MHRAAVLLLTAIPAFLTPLAPHAQEPQPFAAGGIPAVPLPDAPVDYDTAAGQRIRVSVVTDGLTYPWGFAFLPGGRVLVTERLGTLRQIRDGVLDPTPIAGVPEVYTGPLAGLMDVAAHPRFAENRFVYLTYSKPTEEGSTVALARGRFEGEALSEVRDVFVADAELNGGASRLAFAPDGSLYMTVGGAFGGVRPLAQDPASHVGKVLRLRDDGTAADGNPFAGREGHALEVFSLGHRNPMGLAIHPETGEVWGERARADGGRRGQPHPSGPQLRLAGGVLLARVHGAARVGTAVAGADGAAGDRLDPVHRPLGAGVLYRRPVPGLARRPLRRLAHDRARRPHRPPRAYRVQTAGAWSSAGNGCSPISGSASATSSKAPTGCCTC